MWKLNVDRVVGCGIFILNGRRYVWDENEDGWYVLKGDDGVELEIVGDERDENDNVTAFWVANFA